MKRVSLENMMKEVFNNGKVIKTETKDTVYGNECMTTIQYGTFKCKLPVSGISATLKYAKSMSRKPAEKFPVPASQNILAFLYKFKKVIPYYIEMVHSGKGRKWFENRMYINFPEEAKEIMRSAVFSTESDRKYALSTMPKAWEPYKVILKAKKSVRLAV